MKFAIVDGQRVEAQPSLSGKCPSCNGLMVAKCGEERVWHWAHQGSRNCDPWWENETEWHRGWKGHFPVAWQEAVHKAETGERHIADVRTDRGWVIEFQHSYLDAAERRARDAFYRRLIWVVDATRRKTDIVQLRRVWSESVSVGAHPGIRRVFSNDCRILEEWANCGGPVFLDLGEKETLLWLFARSNGSAYLSPFAHAHFINCHGDATSGAGRQFDKFVNDVPQLVANFEAGTSHKPQRGDPLNSRGFRRSPRL